MNLHELVHSIIGQPFFFGGGGLGQTQLWILGQNPNAGQFFTFGCLQSYDELFSVLIGLETQIFAALEAWLNTAISKCETKLACT